MHLRPSDQNLPASAKGRRAARRPLHKRGTFALLFRLPSASATAAKPAFRASSLRFALLPPTLLVALRRLGRAGRDAGEPGPASGVEASGTQRGPGRGGRPPRSRGGT